ncbi:hypothetical protein AQJ91_06170 [Streptomyces dysideae]|uniref:Uncharacterized protein n=1 Tax=Streptomyces dysideae TaxID=909626 RepID=A0A101V488_9ACTN|nr:hypothetical protein AQJ91_06170 [Streptomyces dysideae]
MFRATDMDDQRVGGRAPLDLEEARDGGGMFGSGAQTVDGFGREGHEAPSVQDLQPPSRCHWLMRSPLASLPLSCSATTDGTA